MSVIPSATVLDGWNTLTDFLDWSGLQQTEWTAVATALGQADLDSLMSVAAIHDEDYLTARKELTPARRGALNLMIGAVKAKFGITTTLLPRSTAPRSQAITAPAASSGGPAAAAKATVSAVELQQGTTAMGMRVNLGAMLNQALNQEIPILPEAGIARIRAVYIKVRGDEPIEQSDPQ